MTQIMNLNHLALDIQVALLFLPPVMEGREGVHERLMRSIVAIPRWQSQRERWNSLSFES